MAPESPPLYVPLDARQVRDLDGLRRAVAESRTATLRAHDALMLSSLVTDVYDFRPIHRHGELVLSRFLPPFTRGRPQHIGEIIRHDDGRVAYLKTFRLSTSQVRRGRLMRVLSEADWHPGTAATALGVDRDELLRTLERARLGHLLAPGMRRHDRGAR